MREKLYEKPTMEIVLFEAKEKLAGDPLIPSEGEDNSADFGDFVNVT